MNTLKLQFGDEVRRVTPLPSDYTELVNVAKDYFSIYCPTFSYEN
jgi:hypothetical protein